MILFYSEQQIVADIFINNLSCFLDDQVIEPLSLQEDKQGVPADLLVIDGRKIHPQRLNKIVRTYSNAPLILISNRKFKSLDAVAIVEESTSMRSIADICRLILKKPIERQQTDFKLTEEVLLKKLAEGASNKEISRDSGLADSTVKYHLRNIYSKMGVKNRTQAAIKAGKFIL